MHKRLVAGLSRLVTCLQSNFIGTNFRGLFSNLGIHGLFSFPFVSYWAHSDWLAPGGLMGLGNLTISGEPKLRSGPPVIVLALAASQLVEVMVTPDMKRIISWITETCPINTMNNSNTRPPFQRPQDKAHSDKRNIC